MQRFVIALAFIVGSLFIQNTSEASLSHSLGLNKSSSKAARQLAKVGKKALRHPKKGGAAPVGPVSPYTTLLAQILGSQEGLFLLIHDAYDLNLIGRHSTRRFIRRTLKSDFKVVGRGGRSEFKNFNNGANRRSVRRDYFAFMFNGGLLPWYF